MIQTIQTVKFIMVVVLSYGGAGVTQIGPYDTRSQCLTAAQDARDEARAREWEFLGFEYVCIEVPNKP